MEVPALLVQKLLTLPGVGKRLSALGLWYAFLPTEVGQLRYRGRKLDLLVLTLLGNTTSSSAKASTRCPIS